MKKIWFGRLASFVVLLCMFGVSGGSWGATLYVSAPSGNDENNGSTWSLAKQTIQAAVDAAVSNDTVLVTNGTYNTGARLSPGQTLCPARVVIDKAVRVRSVNGPSNTFLVGQGPRGETAVRCVWMTNNSFLTGFTLTNGFTVLGIGGADENGGGIFAMGESVVVSNCILTACQAYDGGGAYHGALNNCTLSDNMAGNYGGGTIYGTLKNCTLTNNSASSFGGGVYGGMLNNCTLSGNSATRGGGVFDCTLTNCTLFGNSAGFGGGANGGTLYNCRLTGNSAIFGGGADSCTLNTCALSGNLASGDIESYGGGASRSTLNNCTLSDNSTLSGWGGGGVWGSTLNHCIFYSNSAVFGGGASYSTLTNCTLFSNSADVGGGASGSTLYNCTLIGNSADVGGGASGGTLYNCMLSGNSVSTSGGGASGGTLYNCTVYGNTNGGLNGGTARNTISYGNGGYDMSGVDTLFCYTNDPLFVDAAAGNLRLQSNSPCINTGYNPFAPTNVTPYDLDGNPRIAQLIVDKGAYEFQGGSVFELFASAGAHGSIIPSGVIRTTQGANVSFLMNPDQYYHVQAVLTNGASAGTGTNFTWCNISAPGTITVSFAATLAAHGTPYWWMAQFGWTQNFDAVESDDQDGDKLFTWQEYPPNTCPTNANTDGDQYNDGVEVNAGADPLRNDSQTYGALQSHPVSFNFYTSNSVQDLSYGQVMMSVITNHMRVRLTMQSTEKLNGGNWSNVGSLVEWQYPVNSNKYFFRFLGGP